MKENIILSKADELIYKLYKKHNEPMKANYILEKESILEDRIGTRLTVEEPIIEWTKQGKKERLNRFVFLIRKDGRIDIESKKTKDNQNTLDEFLNKTKYTLERCTNNLIRITKEEASITYKLNNHSLEKERTISPSIIYIDNQGKVLQTINLDKKPINKPKIYTR